MLRAAATIIPLVRIWLPGFFDIDVLCQSAQASIVGRSVPMVGNCYRNCVNNGIVENTAKILLPLGLPRLLAATG